MENSFNTILPSRWLQLPPRLYEASQPLSLQQTVLVHSNRQLLQQLGQDQQRFFAGGYSGLLAQAGFESIATVYAGHQFGIYTSVLGDGRVHTLGDIHNRDGQRWELQLKGAGATAFARGNHGRLALAEAISEYLMSEALAGLGIASTRALAIIQHQEQETQSVLLRTSPGFLRFGHLEYLHNQGEHALLKQLCDHLIEEHYPALMSFPETERYLSLLFHIARQSAELLAQWQAAGFCHGVLNTDNMSLLGLTMDVAESGFMETYQADFCPNPNDDEQRYAFAQQVEVGRWNVMALAEALQSLLPGGRVPARLLRHYNESYQRLWLQLMRRKLGLHETGGEDDELVRSLLLLLQDFSIDYSRFMRALTTGELDSVVELYDEAHAAAWESALQTWWRDYQTRFGREPQSPQRRRAAMRTINPKYILRRQHLEAVIQSAEQAQDFLPLHELMVVLQSPYAEHRSHHHLA